MMERMESLAPTVAVAEIAEVHEKAKLPASNHPKVLDRGAKIRVTWLRSALGWKAGTVVEGEFKGVHPHRCVAFVERRTESPDLTLETIVFPFVEGIVEVERLEGGA